MTPHRTPSPSPFDLAAVTRRGLPRDLKHFAANDDERDAFGLFRFFLHLAIGACGAFALIWIALSLPEEAPVPAPVPAIEITYGSAPR